MLEVARVHYLGRNGQLADAMALIADVPSNARREVGQRANAVKKGLTAALSSRQRASQGMLLKGSLSGTRRFRPEHDG